MKKIVILAALTMAAPAAMASKARVEALNNSRQIVDIQNAFDRPYQFMQLGSQATFEWGNNGDGDVVEPTAGNFEIGATRHAEGGFLNKEDDRAYGLYFGRRSNEFSKVVNTVRVAGSQIDDALSGAVPEALLLNGMLLEQNGLNAFYSGKFNDMIWGATLKYSNGKKEGANEYKSNSAGIALGLTNGTWEVELVQGIVGKSELTSGANVFEVESKGLTKVGVGYNINEAMQVYANYAMTKLEGSGTGTFATAPFADLNTTVENKKYSVGLINTVVKDDSINFFYGVAYQNEEQTGIQDFKKSVLPVWLGVEANATSWMVFRGSIQQNILINETEDTAATPKTKSDLDSIAFNAGVGIKLGNGMLDANFATAANGSLNFGNGDVAGGGQEFLSNVAYTYNF